MEAEENKFDADEWMMESVFRYRRLHMYDLHLPVTASDWINEKSCVIYLVKGSKLRELCGTNTYILCDVCLAASDGKNHEIWQVALPDDLLEEEQESCLSKDRDFQLVAGGFCDTKVSSVKCFTSEQCVIISPADTSSLDILKLCTDSSANVMPKVKTIQNVYCNRESSSVSKMSDKCVAFGSCRNNICIADITTQTVLNHTHKKDFSCDEKLGGLESLSQDTLVACGQSSGCLWMLDFRLKEPLKTSSSPNSDHLPVSMTDSKWTMTRAHMASIPGSDDSSSGSLWRLCTDGTIVENSFSDLKKPCFKTCPSTIQKSGKENNNVLKSIKVSHDERPLIAITGFGCLVQIYDSERWKKAEHPDEVEPVFVHDGHQVCCNEPRASSVTYHGWHPQKHGLIMSADSEGNLHVFEASVL